MLMVVVKTANQEPVLVQMEDLVLQFLAQAQENIDKIMHAYHVIHTLENNKF
jgi:hypothetical protein